MIGVVLLDIEQKLEREKAQQIGNILHSHPDVNYLGKRVAGEIRNQILSGEADVVLMATDWSCAEEVSRQKDILSTYGEVSVIAISANKDYDSVRNAFLMGMNDYLLTTDDLESQLDRALQRIVGQKWDAYFSHKIYDKIRIIASHLFDGGKDVKELVDNLVDTIHNDWERDPIACQQVVEKVKRESYKLFIRTKPWLENFIYRGHYVTEIGFEIQSREAQKEQLYRYYQDVDILFQKYNVIDVNKTVYIIGKSIINNIDRKISLDFVADDIYLNKTYISYIFKKMTGIGFNEFLQDVKIDRAKVLLHDPQMMIGDISERLNFCSVSHFGMIFKKHTGYTPTQYRNFIKNAE